jgi:hypothetical protein
MVIQLHLHYIPDQASGTIVVVAATGAVTGVEAGVEK